MNKEYIYIDGKIIVIDEFNDKKVIEYTNKTDEILLEENIIEAITKKITEIKEEEQINNKILKSQRIMRFVPVALVAFFNSLMPSFISLIMGNNALEPISQNVLNGIFANMTQKTFFTSFFGVSSILCGSILFGYETFEYTKYKKQAEGFKNAIEQLEKSLAIEKEKLVKLENAKRLKIGKENIVVKKIETESLIENIESFCELYYDCGFNKEKYYNYYNEGILSKKLGNKYTDVGINEISDYFSKQKQIKRKVLIKPKRSSN